jgi:hypothetical protein
VNIPDPYKVLQVDPDAEDEVIEAAYKRLAKKYHPDVAPGPDAQVRMARINRAREMLRDPIRRAAVDRARARAAGTSARVAAADGRANASRSAYRAPGDDPEGTHDWASGRAPTWPLPGAQDPTQGTFPAASGEPAATSWPSGRSTYGSGYDQRTMGTPQATGAAGPPPGNPSGSRVGFGRYLGWTLGEIARTDLEYLEWLDRMPIGRMYQAEIDVLLRQHGRRVTAAPAQSQQRGLFRRR